jgi:TNF receptor-associated factor 4
VFFARGTAPSFAPHHRSTCGKRMTNCVFANFGCNWRGSFARLPAHRAACRKQPRTCPNGCGAHVSVGPMMMQHLELCPAGEVTCDAPDAEVGQVQAELCWP